MVASRALVILTAVMISPDIPLLDIAAWRDGSQSQRARIAARMDQAQRQSGFLLIENHGVPADAAGPSSARRPAGSSPFRPSRRAAYATPVAGRGWIPVGKEANAFYGLEADTAGHLKESLTIGREFGTGDAATDAAWFAPNVWPAEVPALAALCARYAEAVRGLYDELLDLCAAALGLPEGSSNQRPHPRHLRHQPLPAAARDRAPLLEGQFRVAPHTDWGMLTILDRQAGYGGLQIQTLAGDWVDAPLHEGAYTVNIGDLLSRWTGERWRSTRHRVLPPPAHSPGEELISLIMFMEADVETVINPVAGNRELAPVVAGEWLQSREISRDGRVLTAAPVPTG